LFDLVVNGEQVMSKGALKHLTTAVALTLLASLAQASNYIFYDGAPLAFISKPGVYETFDLFEPDEEGRWAPTRAARRLKTLWQVTSDGQALRWKVKSLAPGDHLGCSSPDKVVLAEGDPSGLLASKALKWRSNALPHTPTNKETNGARQWLDSFLKARRVPTHIRLRAFKALDVQAVQIGPGEPDTLLVQAQVESAKDAKALSVFAVLRTAQNGRMVDEFSVVLYGPPSDGDGYAGETSLAEVADLDGDGVSEVLIHSAAYESSQMEVLARHGKTWKSLVSGVSYGC
jgi:hypothetical protein